jgi:hypothetical protein
MVHDDHRQSSLLSSTSCRMRRSRPSLSTEAGGHGADVPRRGGFARGTPFDGSAGLIGNRSLLNVNSFISDPPNSQPSGPGAP